MLSESFIAAIRAKPKSANTAISRDVGIYCHELQPNPAVRSSFKKSSAPVNAVVVSSTHIFAAQVDKAVVHVYSREKGNQEALVSFPERIHSLTLVDNVVVVLGTAEGRLILWDVCTGRQVSTPSAHLQAVSSLAATRFHLVSGSEDSHIHIWSIPRLLSMSVDVAHQPLRSLSNHRAAITHLALGHSISNTNICVSASRDNTIIVWNYHSGDLLRTFLLPKTPLCLALDPCDRGVYIGFENGSIQLIEFISSDSNIHPLYSTALQATPAQVLSPPWLTPTDLGSVLCISLSYDGTFLLSGHTSGKVSKWDTGRRSFASEVVDLNAPITNLVMESPFPVAGRKTKIHNIIKPRLGEGTHLLTAQFTESKVTSQFDSVVATQGVPTDMLEDAVSRFFRTDGTSPSADNRLMEENKDLWNIINEQRALQKKTWEKYTALKSGTSAS